MTNPDLGKSDHWSTVFTFANVLLSTKALRAVLKPVVKRFHGNAENYYSNFYGLLQENLLQKKFGDDITLTNILLPSSLLINIKYSIK